MLDEALEIIRKLWGSQYETSRGHHYAVEQARLYDVPTEPPELIVAAAAEKAARWRQNGATEMVSTAPVPDVLAGCRRAGGLGSITEK